MYPMAYAIRGAEAVVAHLALSSSPPLIPDPNEILIAPNLPDGYWIEAFYFHKDNKYPGLIGYGLRVGLENERANITLYINHKNAGGDHTTDWRPIIIHKMDFPVAMTFADLNGDGYNDIIICDRYGPNMGKLWDAETKDGGRVRWLKNSGAYDIESTCGGMYFTHTTTQDNISHDRLKVGHFTTRDVLQIMAIPVILKSNDKTSPAPIIVFAPDKKSKASFGPTSWGKDAPFSNEFRLIHDIKVIPGDLDTVLVAGREGIVYLYFDKTSYKWGHVVIGKALPQKRSNPHWGAGSVDVGKVADDPVGYIATSEGFHGNVISIYIKSPAAPKGIASLLESSWTRIEIDCFGPLNCQHTGTVYHVAVGDFDGSGVDAFAIACMGAPTGKPKNQGVYVYKPVNLQAGRFTKFKVTDRSAGRLAIAAFANTRLDIGSISYYVPGHHTGPDRPSLCINQNAFLFQSPTTDIRAYRLNEEVHILVPRPSDVGSRSFSSMTLIEVPGKRLHIYVLAANAKLKLDPKDAVKVMHGKLIMKTSAGYDMERTLAPERHRAANTAILSPDGSVKVGSDGAVFLRMEHIDGHSQGPFRTMSDLPIANVFPSSVPPEDGFRAKPKLLSNGCVDYPLHAWLASRFGEWEIPIKPPHKSQDQAYDVWLASKPVAIIDDPTLEVQKFKAACTVQPERPGMQSLEEHALFHSE
ncbi:hypothetical protein V5O48_006095 [Marasmius crinis-equi]|uniref:Uncharacterized protein n=1 Tax=Marasmius crinis-equi TaxID=585013 RepID=A0ABR3FKE8_9AGAR